MPRSESMKVVTRDGTKQLIESQALALGFHTGEALASVYLKALADVPPNRIFEALAAARKVGGVEMRPPATPR